MQTENVKAELSKIVSSKIGHEILEEKIHPNTYDFLHIIPEGVLKEKFPVILVTRTGNLVMLLAVADLQHMENEEISVEEYVNTSKWGIGYYIGSQFKLKGCKWQPIEERGLNDTSKISRYISLLRCRKIRSINIGEEDFDKRERCRRCNLEKCPISKIPKKREGASWDNEIQENNAGQKLFDTIAIRVCKLGIEATHWVAHDEASIVVMPGDKKDTATVRIPQNLVVEVMSNPDGVDIENEVNKLSLKLGRINLKDMEAGFQTLAVSEEGVNRAFVYEYWKDDVLFCLWKIDKKEIKKRKPKPKYKVMPEKERREPNFIMEDEDKIRNLF